MGRTHQCAIQIFDLVSKNEEGDKFKADMMNLAFQTLTDREGDIKYSEIS